MSDVPDPTDQRLDDQGLDPEIARGELDLSELDLSVTPSSSPDWWDIGKKKRRARDTSVEKSTTPLVAQLSCPPPKKKPKKSLES